MRGIYQVSVRVPATPREPAFFLDGVLLAESPEDARERAERAWVAPPHPEAGGALGGDALGSPCGVRAAPAPGPPARQERRARGACSGGGRSEERRA